MASACSLAFAGGALPRLARATAPVAAVVTRRAATRRPAVLPALRPAAGVRLASAAAGRPSPPRTATPTAVASPPAPVSTAATGTDGGEAAAAEAPPSWKVKLLFDGDCPLCVREVNFLKKKDDGRGVVAFVDISDPVYDPAANAGLDYETAMGRIHAIEADGSVVQDVAVFRRVYEELGMGWVYAVTKAPAVEAVANQLYGVWARSRLWLTGRGTMEEVMKEREDCKDSCRI